MNATDWLYHPSLYGWLQQTIMSPRCRQAFVQHYLCPQRGERFLDLGCGTGQILNSMPPLDYWGLDSNQRYIDFASKKFKDRGNFIAADIDRTPWPVTGLFDRAVAIGVLHHLPDDQVLKLLKTVRALLKRGGKFITMDGCYEKGQNPVARMLLSMDRGKYVRTREGYTALAYAAFGQVRFESERRLLRLPYSHLIMEMVSD